MVTYFDDPSVQVTSAAIRVDGRAYPLRELARVWHRRGKRSWRTVAGRGALGASLLVPVGLAVLGVVAALSLRASPGVTVAIVAAAVVVGLSVGPLADFVLGRLDNSYARGAHDYEIWASWRGTPVLLLRTRDALRFGQVYRALQRAMERQLAAPPRR